MNLNKTPELIELVIQEDQAGERIDKVLATIPEISSRNRALQLITEGFVKLESKIVRPSLKTKAGQVFHVSIPVAPQPSDLKPYNFALDILHEDSDVIVLNKPAGLVVHPSAGHSEMTLVNALLAHTKDLSMGFNETRPGIVHRLDKDTSGLLVVCKNNSAHENLAQQFKNRSIHRIYWALVHGEVRFQEKEIQNQLGRHPTDRKKFASVKNGGKKAITHAKKLSFSKNISHLQLKLETGRTHQIRVHISELGHPIVGDSLYGAKKRIGSLENRDLKNEIENLHRIGLHAKELGFIHPKTKKELFFTSPWPKDLETIVRLCGF